MPDILNADSFLKKLGEGKLKTPLICTGIAKPIDRNQEAFLFSPGTSGVIWTKIHTKTVEKVEFLRECRCRDHLFPLVRIHFKEPPDNEPFAATFYSMLHTYTMSLDPSIITGPSTALLSDGESAPPVFYLARSDPGPEGWGGGRIGFGFHA